MHKKDLWLEIRNYTFDHVVSPGLWDKIDARFGHTDPSLLAFAHKIGRKHNWSTSFTLRAIQEYKKFIFLGLVSDFQVTPSKIIDVVWHEHLLFSKAYREFCDLVIRQPFDHYPELVPMEDQTGRFSAQYLDTVALYKKEFDLDPPVAIWGDTKFDQEQVKKNGYTSKKKNSTALDSGGDSIIFDTVPLYSHFESEPAAAFPEFSGYEGGDAGGGGASGDWGDGNSSDSGSDGGGDSGGCSGGCGGGGD